MDSRCDCSKLLIELFNLFPFKIVQVDGSWQLIDGGDDDDNDYDYCKNTSLVYNITDNAAGQL